MILRLNPRLPGIAGIVASLGLILSTVGVAESYYERFEAQKLLAVVSGMQVGYTTESRAKEAMRPFSRYNTLDEYPKNSITEPFDQFEFRNRALSLLHLSPPTRVWIEVGYKDGSVVHKSAQALSSSCCSASVSESIHNEMPPVAKATEDGRSVGIRSGPAGVSDVEQVRDDISTSLARRQLDWQIDLSCMTWSQGCADARKTLRGVFLPVSTGQRSN